MDVRDYTFLGTTRSLCPHCRRVVDAKIVTRNGRVYFRKNCPEHGWVEDFIPKSSGPNYIPHVTLGIAKEDFANQLKAKPFTQFTFSPIGAAVYHLGDFGTAAKQLWKYQGK